jgi:hypothetical protein
VIYLTLPELLHVAGRTLGDGYAVRDFGLLRNPARACSSRLRISESAFRQPT